VRDGGKVTICNTDPFYASVFGYSQYDRLNVGPGKGRPHPGDDGLSMSERAHKYAHRLKSGACETFRVHNPGTKDVQFKVFDEIHSQFKIIITVAPRVR